ncbi:MAG: hypothetical protein H0U36_11860 [Nocardioidaceae bacterium]|nr:hypothetical protein [Nocardioidaceae bacterium]
MTTRQPRARAKADPPLGTSASRDFRRLPAPVDLSRVVVTHDVDPETHEITSTFATPDIADMVRTGAIGGGF